MDKPDPRLRNYQFDGHFWRAVAFVPFWNGDLPIWFHTYDKQPTARQFRIATAILDYPQDLRVVVEKCVFDYYQTDVVGCIDFGDSETEERCAPRLTQPAHIWKRIPGAELSISDLCRMENEDSIEFKLAFDCSWDEEHGLGVKLRDWTVYSIGGAVD